MERQRRDTIFGNSFQERLDRSIENLVGRIVTKSSVPDDEAELNNLIVTRSNNLVRKLPDALKRPRLKGLL